MLTIKVIRKRDNQPLEGAWVGVYFGMVGQNSRDGRTNGQGDVHLDIHPGSYKVVINSSNNYSEWHQLVSGLNVIYY